MINIRAGSGGDPANILREASSRIGVIAQVHERLIGSHDIFHIDLAVYLGDICKDVQAQLIDCELEFTAPLSIVVPTDRAVRVALILNELVMNAGKHAPGTEGSVRVRVALKPNSDRLVLSVRDDGEGLPSDFDVANARTMGMRIVTALVEQLGGELRVERPARGTEFVLDCPIRTREE